ncbi:hypothetical protein FOPE_05256 [Fonsecaea pedrosoi]|nr:hypothetical protein FOPE_05256 [Fonsecaea pedrosoi]
MAIHTALTEALGIQGELSQLRPLHDMGGATTDHVTVPVVQRGMQWVGYAELASAVSNAGGLGIVSRRTEATVHIGDTPTDNMVQNDSSRR